MRPLAHVRRPSRWRQGASAAVALLLVAACSGGDDGADDGSATSTTGPADGPVSTEPLFTPSDDASSAPTTNPDDGGPTLAAETSDGVTTAVGGEVDDEGGDADDGATTTVAVIPDTGVPGIDSSDAFCRAWAEFGGTFQGLAIAWGVGDADLAAHNEVAASGAVLAAVDELDANTPAELESERADLMALVAPMSRRATAARDELVAAGVADVGIVELGDAWLVALADAGLDEPAIVISVPETVDETALSTAAAAFAAARPPLIDDPSMITDVAIPATEQYLIDNCPDQGTLLGNDDVDVAP